MCSERDGNGPVLAFFSDAPWTGGAERYIHLLAAGAAEERFTPVLIMNRNPALDTLKHWMETDGVTVHEVSLRLPSSLSGTRAFVRLLRRLRPVLLHLNLPGPYDSQFSLVAPLARLAGVQHVVSTEHLPMVPPFAKGGILKSFGTRWIDRVITVSEDNRAHLVRAHRVPGEKIRVVHVGIPEPPEQPAVLVRRELGLGSGGLLLITVGTLEGRKGHLTVFRAMTELQADMHLLVVGTGELEPELRAAAGTLGISGRVHFLGHRDDVAALLREADLMVHASVVDATPYVIVEAMAAGLPVVASNVYGIPELVADGETGVLVPAGESAAVADAIRFIAGNPETMRSMGERGRRRFEEHFRIERCLADTFAVYAELIGSLP